MLYSHSLIYDPLYFCCAVTHTRLCVVNTETLRHCFPPGFLSLVLTGLIVIPAHSVMQTLHLLLLLPFLLFTLLLTVLLSASIFSLSPFPRAIHPKISVNDVCPILDLNDDTEQIIHCIHFDLSLTLSLTLCICPPFTFSLSLFCQALKINWLCVVLKAYYTILYCPRPLWEPFGPLLPLHLL